MTWTTTGDPDAFLDAAGAFLRAAPAANSVTLTTVEALRARGDGAAGDSVRGDQAPPLLAWWRAPDGDVTGAAMQTTPYPLHLSTMPPDATTALAELLAAHGHALRGVNGEATATEAFVVAWSARTGARARLHRRMRLHRLDTLVPPDPLAPGTAVVAGPRHRDLLIAWYGAFGDEIEEPARDLGPPVDDRLSHGGLALWMVDGEPVSLAGTTRAVAGAARVAPVYTPPEHRGRGYAAAVTAAVTRAALASGVAEVLLYTDLANPTSNRLYARLGYRPVEDSVAFVFDG
jgi:GNAT superfamily N-acetyltransferase